MSRFRILRLLLLSGCTCAVLLAGAATVQAQQAAPPQVPDDNAAPGRVARLAYLTGQVQFAPAGEDDWGSVDINRPMVIGDRLLTGDDGRAALELGDASVRLDHDSAFDFLNLDENNVQVELSQGTLNLAVREMADGENFEIDTPTVAFVASTPGVYRIDDSPTGTGSMVTVFRGSGIVYGENGVSRQVVEGTSYRFNDSTLTSVDVEGLPQADDFDRFCETRDANHERYANEQRPYVPPAMIGGEDLYQYGRWDAIPEYGNVWYPTSVPVGWAPYRYGHWAWIDPWGWTWVDNQPWGFAPFHYGRWVYVGNRWGWLPGPVNVRPVYAPAMVAFIGGSGVSLSIRVGGGGPVGWFPLGPRDVYVPWFHSSRGYFTNVNITNIRRPYVDRRVINNFYNDYRNRRFADIHQHNRYRYRSLPGAVTVVPRKVFTDARPVHGAALKLDPTQLKRLRVAVGPDVNPGRASLGLRRSTARPAVLHGRQAFARPVVARHAPPPRPVAFAARQKVIASQHGQPLSADQMRNLGKGHATVEARIERVKLVAGPRASGATPANRVGAQPPRPSQASTPALSTTHRAVVPRAAEVSPRRENATNPPPSRQPVRPQPVRPLPLRAGELPSARFRHPDRAATLPRPPVLRSAEEPPHAAPPAARQLPVVRPLERAPRAPDHRAVSPQRETNNAAQRALVQQSQQPRQVQEQTGQRIRAQQAQQRNGAVQQQRAQAQQAQRQREVQGQAQQRMREQQIQRQRQPQPMRMPQVQQPRYQPPPRATQRPPERQAPQPRTRSSDQQHPPRSKKHPDSSSGNTPIR